VSSEDKFDPKKFGEDLRDQIHQDIHDRISDRMRLRAERRARRSGRWPGGILVSGLWPGAILMIIGTAILLDHMGIISVERLWRLWPVLLIAVGAIRFVECRNRVFSVFLMLLGTLFLLGNLGYLRLTAADFWPVVLIGLGAMLIWSRFEMPKLPPVSSGGSNTINEMAMFGGVERRVTVNNFAGGSATATFGGVELDFRSADIEGEEAVVYVEAIFGGIEVTVPDRWTVIYEGQSIFGGYTDETRPPLPEVPGAPPKKRLILRGRAIFGGITVKN
jgi:predicted membrane protein